MWIWLLGHNTNRFLRNKFVTARLAVFYLIFACFVWLSTWEALRRDNVFLPLVAGVQVFPAFLYAKLYRGSSGI